MEQESGEGADSVGGAALLVLLLLRLSRLSTSTPASRSRGKVE